MKELFGDNPTLIIAIVVFVLCVIIGFFADRHLRKENKIGKILDDDEINITNKEDKNVNDEITNDSNNTQNSNTNNTRINDNIKKEDQVNQAIDNIIDGNTTSNNNQGVVNNVNNQQVNNNVSLNNQSIVNNDTISKENIKNNRSYENIVSNPDDEINNMF